MTKRFIQAQVSFRQAQLGDDTVEQDLVAAGLNLNNVFIPASVLKEAIPLFEGVRTYVDHGGWFFGRSIREMSGWITGVKYDEEADKVVGTRHFTENQAGRDMKEMVMSIIEGRTPEDLYGASFSMWVEGDVPVEDDAIEFDEPIPFVVTAITQVDSVDDVDRPAAGGGWRKKVAASENQFSTIMEMAEYDDWLGARPDYAKRLRAEYQRAKQSDEIKGLRAKLAAKTEELDGARALVQSAEAALHAERVSRILATSGLPAPFIADLRGRMIAAPAEEWDGILEAERAKFKATTAASASSGRVQQGQPARDVPGPASKLDKAHALMNP